MTHIKLFRNVLTSTIQKQNWPGSKDDHETFASKTGVLIFAGLLIACSFAVGCSSDKPKTTSATNSPQIAPSAPPIATNVPVAAPLAETPAKPTRKRVVRKAPVTVKYEDEVSGISFRYPRRYVLKTGEDAEQLASSSTIPMNFVQPGGALMAAVTIPPAAFPKSDLLSAAFGVSVNRTMTAEQCAQFSTVQTGSASEKNTNPNSESAPKLILGDLELQSADSESNTSARKETTKYYHVFENGGCYEFALDVATTGAEPDEGEKAIDRVEVFNRLEKILATVKINPVEPSAQTTGSAATAAVAPAQ